MPENLQLLFTRYTRGRNGMIAGVAVAVIVAIWALSRWATAPEWVALMPGMPIDAIAQVTAQMDEQGVPYRLTKGGSEVDVAATDLARARVLLARDGVPAVGRPGFELFDRPSWGMTDFTQRINYRRALEGELERTITQMRGVEAAQVHLALNESSAFRRSSQPEAASVVLKLTSGARPGPDLVEGISSLVASSVDGLNSNQITVLDNAGHLLSAAVEPGNASGLTQRQLGLRQDVESYLEQKAEELVAQVVGTGNASVRVAADLNFDKLDRTSQIVDPDQQVTTHEEASEIKPSAGQVGAASTATSATYEPTRKIETFSAAAGSIKRLTVSVLVNDAPGADGGQPVPRTAEELARIEALVRNAVGLDATRGDAITVVGLRFDLTPPGPVEPESGPSIWQRLLQFQKLIIAAVALVLAFMLGLRAIRAIQASQMAQLSAQQQLALKGAGSGELPVAAGAKAPEIAKAMAPRHAEALSRSAESPDMAARVLRAWIKES